MKRCIAIVTCFLMHSLLMASPQPSVRSSQASDPTYRWNFSYIVRMRDTETGQFDNTIQVHTQTTASVELAQQTLAAAAGMVQLLKDHLGRMFRISESGNLHIWLCENGESGGQLSKDNLYIFSIGKERTPAQRCRELAHELGHSALPGISGYTEPEPWANGYLGEQMLLRWLDQSMKDGTAKPVQYFGAAPKEITEMVTSRYENLLAAWRNGQFTEADLNRRDSVGMKALIGFVAYIQTTYGDEMLSESFRRLMAPTSLELLAAFKRSVNDSLPCKLMISQPTRIYLPVCRVKMGITLEQILKKPEWRKVNATPSAPVEVSLRVK
ncbi:MAG: hypothetical protein ACYC1M_05920 [Armatimonadota bacterium]